MLITADTSGVKIIRGIIFRSEKYVKYTNRILTTQKTLICLFCGEVHLFFFFFTINTSANSLRLKKHI